MDYDESQQVKLKKKKYSKKGESVPSDNLGFRPQVHADIIDPRNIKRSRLRSKKKYTPKSTKQNFMARLRFIIDVSDLPADTETQLFRVTKKSQWAHVKKVLYRSRQKIFCSICLEEDMVASQITYCGHIYCFHCILMHFTKSSNCYLCPICKQLTDKDELKSCQPKYDQQPAINEQIVFNLKYREGEYVFDAETLCEDLHYAPVIRMRTKGIIPIYEKEVQQINQELQKTVITDRNYHYLMEALGIASSRLEKAVERSLQHAHINLRENEVMKQNTIMRFITGNQEIFNRFYQEKTGNLLFLHKICKKYLCFDKLAPVFTIKSTILEKEELDFASEGSQYKELLLFNFGCEADAVIVDISSLVSPEENKKFLLEVDQFIKMKEKYYREQEVQMEKLRLEYEAEQAYIRQLKQQQQSQYYFDVKLPPTLEPSDFNDHSFPSLMSSKSQQPNSTNDHEELNLPLNKIKTGEPEVKKLEFNLQKQGESFPELSQLQINRTQESKAIKGGRKKKKKEKFIDMTHEILFSRDETEQI